MNLFSPPKNKRFLIGLALLLPFAISTRDILSGSIPFWFDPARDFLLAAGNLKKPSLIGPPTGIPGLFYGPYWIWLISLGMLLSKDPRFIVILIQALPYFTLFPYLLFKATRSFGSGVSALLWLIFILSFKNYTTYLWNPHLAPLLFLAVVFLSISPIQPSKTPVHYLRFFILGFLTGLVANIHMAFGIGVTLAVLLFPILNAFLDKPRAQSSKRLALNIVLVLIAILVGIIASFLPLILFETRHGLIQSKAFAKTLIATLQGTSEITLTGFSRSEILSYFFSTLGRLLQISGYPLLFAYGLSLAASLWLGFKRKLALSKIEKKLLAFLLLTGSIVLTVFLLARNPVWHYHFIASEIIFLLLLGLLASKSLLTRRLLAIWTGFLLLSATAGFVKSFSDNPLAISSLASKKFIVSKIFQDANNQSFAVFAYDPAIYTYDFDYLFAWLAEERGLKIPETVLGKVKSVYLIIPAVEKAIELDFINYKTPNDEYQTVSEWKAQDGTLIVKREKLN